MVILTWIFIKEINKTQNKIVRDTIFIYKEYIEIFV
jgi:hypothetical protein